MNTPKQQKHQLDSVHFTRAERDIGEDDGDKKSKGNEYQQFKTSKSRQYQHRRTLSTTNNGAGSLSNLSCKFNLKNIDHIHFSTFIG